MSSRELVDAAITSVPAEKVVKLDALQNSLLAIGSESQPWKIHVRLKRGFAIGWTPTRYKGNACAPSCYPFLATIRMWSPGGLIPNPPKDTDGRREESGRGVRELQGK